jgi:hypothetical protein
MLDDESFSLLSVLSRFYHLVKVHRYLVVVGTVVSSRCCSDQTVTNNDLYDETAARLITGCLVCDGSFL